MYVVEEFVDDNGETKLKRTWHCCGQVWTKEMSPNDLKEVAWTPICPKCGEFDGSFFT